MILFPATPNLQIFSKFWHVTRQSQETFGISVWSINNNISDFKLFKHQVQFMVTQPTLLILIYYYEVVGSYITIPIVTTSFLLSSGSLTYFDFDSCSKLFVGQLHMHVLSKKSSTCGQEEPEIKSLTLGFLEEWSIAVPSHCMWAVHTWATGKGIVGVFSLSS